MQVMSNVKNLKTAITQLMTVAKVKFSGRSVENYALFDNLQQVGSESFRLIKELTSKVCLHRKSVMARSPDVQCDDFSTTDLARTRRASWRKVSNSVMKRQSFDRVGAGQVRQIAGHTNIVDDISLRLLLGTRSRWRTKGRRARCDASSWLSSSRPTYCGCKRSWRRHRRSWRC